MTMELVPTIEKTPEEAQKPKNIIYEIIDKEVMIGAIEMALEARHGPDHKFNEIFKDDEIQDEDLTRWEWNEIGAKYSRHKAWPSIRKRALMLKNGKTSGLCEIDWAVREDEEIIPITTREYIEILRKEHEQMLINLSWEEIERLSPKIRKQAIKLKNTESAT